jgi:protein CpxP
MSLKGRFFSVLTLALAFGVFGTISFAQTTTPTDPAQKQDREGRGFRREGRPDGPGGRHGGPAGFGELRGIDLTDAQKQQVKSIFESNKPDEATMTQMRTLVEAKRNGTITADQEAQLKALREQGQAKRESIHQQILSILTPEQKQQIEQRRQEMQKRREEWRQKRDQNKQSTDKVTTN